MSQSDNFTKAKMCQCLAEAEAALAALRAGKADTLTGDACPVLFQFKSAAEAREQAETALRESESRLRALFDSVEGIVWEADATTFQFSFVSPKAERLLGYPLSRWLEEPTFWADHIHPEDRDRAVGFCIEETRAGRNHEFEYRMLAADGRIVWLRCIVTVVAEPGRPVRLRGIMVDITERKQTEAFLACQTQVLKLIATGAPLATTLTTLHQQLEALEPGMLASVLLLDEDGVRLRHGAAPSLPEAYTRAIDGLAIGPNVGSCGTAAFRGEAVIVEDIATDPLWKDYRELALAHGLRACCSTPIFDAQRRLLGTFAIYYRQPGRPSATHLRCIELATDLAAVTIGKHREETALRASEARNAELARFNQEVLDALTAHICVLAEDGTILAVNKAWRSFAAANPPARARADVGANYLAICEAAHGEDAATAREVIHGLRAAARGEVPEFRLEYPCHSPGAPRWFLLRATRFEDSGRTFLVVAHVDITARKQAEEARARLATAIEQAAEAVVITDTQAKIQYVNPAFEKVTGYSPQEALGRNPRFLKSGKHNAEFYQRLWATLTRGEVWRGHFVNKRKDGTLYEEEATISPVRDPAGRIINYVAVLRDITREAQLEAQLRQSQKLEAIGQLAGGVAHDFNNILTVILLQTELITGRGGLPDAAREGVQQIRAAAERAANLTRQLLLFSRRQVLQARDLDLNNVVSNLAKMLQRIIGEDVRLELRLHPAPLMTHADTGMLDQVLMNLAVNARDAMPEGGRLTIETTTREISAAEAAVLPDVRPGFYVGLRVSDTGCGIPPEILPRIFEPFFSTKEPGKGTGLGLATVFGIVKQHGGCIQVASEPGRGTTFEVYLPALAETAAAASATASRPAPRGGTETILLVEDDPEVRSLTRATLERHGYRVLEAPDGLTTLGLWRQHRDAVALLLTDLVMPGGLSGRDLARRLRLDRPQLKVIYTSGYSAELAGREWHPGPGEAFLQKPCPVELLLETVRQCLDAPADASPA